MDYTKFLQSRDEKIRLPYFGGNTVCDDRRSYRLRETPPTPAWYEFTLRGRNAEVVELIDAEPENWHLKTRRGYIAHHQLVKDDHQAPLFGISSDEEIQRFTPVSAVEWFDGQLWFTNQEFESEVEMSVRDAFEDDQSIVEIKGVTPALAQVFLLESTQRLLAQEALVRAAEEAERAEYERQMAEWERSVEGRIAHALSHSGAEMLDWRNSGTNQAIVRYRLGRQRFECVIDRTTLQIIDSGICLEGADSELNLSSLPSAVQEAIDTGQLHVYRRV